MIIESIIFVFIYSMIKRYNFINAQDFPRRGVVFPLLYIVLQIFSVFMIKKGMSPYTFRMLNVVGFSLFFVYFGLNWKYVGILTMAFGVLLNLLVMALNSGTMPIDPYYYKMISTEADYQATYYGYNLLHSLLDDNTKLSILGDVIPLMPPYPFPKVISVGDVCIGIGFLMLSITTLRGDYKGERDSSPRENFEEEVKIFPRYNMKTTKEREMEDTKFHNLGDLDEKL